MNHKTCTKCSQTFEATTEFFYRNAGGKYDVTPRCKACVNQDNAESHLKRLSANPEKVRAQATARSARSYQKNLDESRARHRDYQLKNRQDLVKGPLIKARKRAGGAGLTPEQIEEIRSAQQNLCAICQFPDPTDLDHCHTTGTVRWLLCKHCNRGLGAFRDNPEWLEKAAQLLRQKI